MVAVREPDWAHDGHEPQDCPVAVDDAADVRPDGICAQRLRRGQLQADGQDRVVGSLMVRRSAA